MKINMSMLVVGDESALEVRASWSVLAGNNLFEKKIIKLVWKPK